MVSITIIAPFRYFFNGTMRWVSGGQTLTFNTSRIEDRAHLKLLLDPNFGCKKFIQVDPKVKEMIATGNYQVEEVIGEPLIESPSSFIAPPELPAESPFIPSYDELKEEVTPEKPVDENKIEVQSIEPVVVESLPDPSSSQTSEDKEYSLSEQIQIRYEELDNAHYTKVKSLSEELGLEYSNKQDSITQILSQEFQRSIETIKNNLKDIKEV